VYQVNMSANLSDEQVQVQYLLNTLV
jgi:hypothetical protein